MQVPVIMGVSVLTGSCVVFPPVRRRAPKEKRLPTNSILLFPLRKKTITFFRRPTFSIQSDERRSFLHFLLLFWKWIHFALLLEKSPRFSVFTAQILWRTLFNLIPSTVCKKRRTVRREIVCKHMVYFCAPCPDAFFPWKLFIAEMSQSEVQHCEKWDC